MVTVLSAWQQNLVEKELMKTVPQILCLLFLLHSQGCFAQHQLLEHRRVIAKHPKNREVREKGSLSLGFSNEIKISQSRDAKYS